MIFNFQEIRREIIRGEDSTLSEMNVHDPARRNKFGRKREGTGIVTSLFHIGCGQTSVKPSNQDEIVKIPAEVNDSLP